MSIVKRARTEGGQLTTRPDKENLSNDVVQLLGHESDVLCVEYDQVEDLLASGSSDRCLFLWNSQHENFAVLRHKGAVLDTNWSRDSRCVYTASSDLTVNTWDVETGQRLIKHVGHEDMVNAITTPRRGSQLIVSGSDDGSVGIWEADTKEAQMYWYTEYPVLAVACDETAQVVYTAGVDPEIKAWDTRKPSEPLYSMPGHKLESSVTSLHVSPDGKQLVSNASDNTLRTWDISPFVSQDKPSRSIKLYNGAIHGMEQNLHRACWSPNGQKLLSASADQTVVVWNALTGQLESKLTGHQGVVNDVSVNAASNKVASASTDRSIIIGQLA